MIRHFYHYLDGLEIVNIYTNTKIDVTVLKE